MGDTMMGSAKHTGNAPLMTRQQESALNQMLQGLGPEANQALMNLLQGMDPEQMQEIFQQTYVDPAMMTYEQEVLPQLQQRFVDVGAGSSSALNQALASSARDMSTMLGSQFGNFMQGQQQMGLGALSALNAALGQRSFDPIIQQRQGLAGPLLGAAGRVAGAAWS